MPLRAFLACLVIVWSVNPAAADDEGVRAGHDFFENKIRPVLINRCFKCHAGEKHEGKLRLDRREFVLRGGQSELPHPTTTPGRDHNRHGFTVWLAGGGIKGGHVHGATDDAGFAAVQDKVHVHDLHATILHLLGLNHEQLTYRYAGRDFRLTDVHGRVVREILA